MSTGCYVRVTRARIPDVENGCCLVTRVIIIHVTLHALITTVHIRIWTDEPCSASLYMYMFVKEFTAVSSVNDTINSKCLVIQTIVITMSYGNTCLPRWAHTTSHSIQILPQNKFDAINSSAVNRVIHSSNKLVSSVLIFSYLFVERNVNKAKLMVVSGKENFEVLRSEMTGLRKWHHLNMCEIQHK